MAGRPHRWAGTWPATPNGGQSLGPATVVSRSPTTKFGIQADSLSRASQLSWQTLGTVVHSWEYSQAERILWTTKNSVCVYVKNKMTANKSWDYMDINITVAMMALESFRQLQVIHLTSFEELLVSFLSCTFLQIITVLIYSSCSNYKPALVTAQFTPANS